MIMVMGDAWEPGLASLVYMVMLVVLQGSLALSLYITRAVMVRRVGFVRRVVLAVVTFICIPVEAYMCLLAGAYLVDTGGIPGWLLLAVVVLAGSCVGHGFVLRVWLKRHPKPDPSGFAVTVYGGGG